MPPLPADSIHARACKLKCEKILTRPANKKLAFAAGNKIKPVLKQLDTALTGLGDKAVISHRIAFGRNKVSRSIILLALEK